MKYQVKFFDAKKSRKGRGVQIREFVDPEAAALFAADNRLYAKPCQVQPAAEKPEASK